VLKVFKDVRVEASVHEEALVIIEHQRDVVEVLIYIDAIRATIREANAAGKVAFGPRRPNREDPHGDISLSTLHLLTDLSGAEAVVCDDRALNKEPFAQESSGRRVRAFTTLDVIEELNGRGLLTEESRRTLRHRLRSAGAVLMPADPGEIANAALRSGAMKSAEFRAIEESIDLAHLAGVPSFPREIPWFAGLNMATKAAILEVWKSEPDHKRAAVPASLILQLIPNPQDWVTQWGDTPPPGWVDAVRSISIAALAMPVELNDDALVAAYNEWLEESVLEHLRAVEPEVYERVVAHSRSLIESAREDKGDEEAS
jgi:hypothetical protein